MGVINRRQFLYALAAETKRPNIVFFIADDLGWRDIEPYGSTQVRTPVLAKLAKESLCFDAMFTATAMCAPLRQMILTGMYPVRNGAYPNHSRVYDGVKGLPVYFQELGYRVARIGKKHFGPDSAFPFEELTNDEPEPADLRGVEKVFTESAQPFFLWIASHQPHMPRDRGDASAYPPAKIQVPPQLVDDISTRQRMSAYFAEITWMDSQLGAILEALEKSGRAKDTVFVFCGEHGTQSPYSKWTLYENGLKAAFMIRWPGRIKPDTRTGAMIQYVDLLPTLLEAAGGRAPSSIDGRSFTNVLSGKSNRHRDYVFGVQTTRGIINGGEGYPIRSVRDARYKYIRNLRPDLPFQCVLTDPKRDSIIADWERLPHGKARADFFRRRPAEELYDLESDPYELKDRAGDASLARIKSRLAAQLDRWMIQQGDKGWETERKAKERQMGGGE